MEKDLPAEAGTALSGKEQERLPENLRAKARGRKLSRKTQARVPERVQASDSRPDKEDATAGDDFYSGVLERFGIQI